LIGLTKLPESINLFNLPDSPPQPQTPTPITNVADTAAALEAMVQLVAATLPPEVIDLSPDIEPTAQLLANHFNVLPAISKHNGNQKLQRVPFPCGNIVWGIFVLYNVKTYTKIYEWESHEKTVKAITKHLEGKKYVGTPMGKKLLALALDHLPNLSGCGAKNVIACILGNCCADSGIPFDPEQVANSCAKSNALTQILKSNQQNGCPVLAKW
jgi:hypothetical protein